MSRTLNRVGSWVSPCLGRARFPKRAVGFFDTAFASHRKGRSAGFHACVFFCVVAELQIGASAPGGAFARGLLGFPL